MSENGQSFSQKMIHCEHEDEADTNDTTTAA